MTSAFHEPHSLLRVLTSFVKGPFKKIILERRSLEMIAPSVLIFSSYVILYLQLHHLFSASGFQGCSCLMTKLGVPQSHFAWGQTIKRRWKRNLESSRQGSERESSPIVPCGKTIKELRSLTEDKKSSATFPKDYVNSTGRLLG